MKRIIYIFFSFVYVFIALNLSSCKKELLFSNDDLSFSQDTILFDTIFTTVGSTTQRFKIYNKSNKPLKINEIRLQGGKNSPYRINVDGVSGLDFSDIIIPARDSLFCFVEVTLGVNGKLYPYIVSDSILFKTDKKGQSVILTAWGRDAYFHYNDENSDDDPWKNDKPHVVYGVAYVDSDKTLTIPAGTEIYLHKGAMIYVRGKLHIEGSYNNKVVIQGDRLEEYYKDVSGQYYGIYFDHAKTSTINNCVIKNGISGIHLYGNNPNNSDYTLKITNSIIENNASYGIFNYAGGKIYGENLVVSNNGAYAYFVLSGGDCNFRQSQFLSWGAEGVGKPAIAIKNYYNNGGTTEIGSINEMSFYNSIIYGPEDNQIIFDTISYNGVTMNFIFRNNCIKLKNQITSSHFIDNLYKDPKFKNVSLKDYKINGDSPCINAGNFNYSTPFDIENNPRTSLPDIGAYEIE
jgi:hypothetical protein